MEIGWTGTWTRPEMGWSQEPAGAVQFWQLSQLLLSFYGLDEYPLFCKVDQILLHTSISHWNIWAQFTPNLIGSNLSSW